MRCHAVHYIWSFSSWQLCHVLTLFLASGMKCFMSTSNAREKILHSAFTTQSAPQLNMTTAPLPSWLDLHFLLNEEILRGIWEKMASWAFSFLLYLSYYIFYGVRFYAHKRSVRVMVLAQCHLSYERELSHFQPKLAFENVSRVSTMNSAFVISWVICFCNTCM